MAGEGAGHTRALRVHELGHTMGLSHVTTRDSFMKWLIEPNDFDKEAFRVAARRPPGNRSPDVDPANFTLNAPVQLQHDLARGPAVQPIERVRSRGSPRTRSSLLGGGPAIVDASWRFLPWP